MPTNKISIIFSVGGGNYVLTDSLMFNSKAAYLAATDEEIAAQQLERWKNWFISITCGMVEDKSDAALTGPIDSWIVSHKDDLLAEQADPDEISALREQLELIAAGLPQLPPPELPVAAEIVPEEPAVLGGI